MNKLLLLFAVVSAVVTAPADSNVSLLKRLLEVLEKRSMSWFRYDGNTRTLQVTFNACIPSDKQKCDDQANVYSLILYDSKGKEMGEVLEAYSEGFQQPYRTYNMDFLRDGQSYMFEACVRYNTGVKNSCNTATFTAGQTTEYGSRPYSK